MLLEDEIGKEHECSLCKRKFCSAIYMFFHMREQKRQVQEILNEELEPQETLEQPETHEKHDDQYKCKECTSTFSFSFPLELHIKRNHLGNQACPDCN